MSRERSQARPQVRLDADVAEWVTECSDDWEVSLSEATNKLLRALRDEPSRPPEPEPVPAAVSDNGQPHRPPQRRLPKGANPRLAAILAANAADARQ